MDLSRVIQAAAKAALEGQDSTSQDGKSSEGKKPKKKSKAGLSTPRALLIGAGLFTAGRLLIGSRGRGMLEDLQERLIAYAEDDEEPGPGQDGDYEDEDYEDEDHWEGEGPEAEEDEDYDDYEDEGEDGDEDDLDDAEDGRPRGRRGAASGAGS